MWREQSIDYFILSYFIRSKVDQSDGLLKRLQWILRASDDYSYVIVQIK